MILLKFTERNPAPPRSCLLHYLNRIIIVVNELVDWTDSSNLTHLFEKLIKLIKRKRMVTKAEVIGLVSKRQRNNLLFFYSDKGKQSISNTFFEIYYSRLFLFTNSRFHNPI